MKSTFFLFACVAIVVIVSIIVTEVGSEEGPLDVNNVGETGGSAQQAPVMNKRIKRQQCTLDSDCHEEMLCIHHLCHSPFGK
jgi:hypothetical protein